MLKDAPPMRRRILILRAISRLLQAKADRSHELPNFSGHL
jgi:hypothetical protein